VEYRWRVTKIIDFILEFCVYLPKENKERKLTIKSERLLLTYWLSMCLSKILVVTWCCVLAWVTKTVIYAGRIWPACRSTPVLEVMLLNFFGHAPAFMKSKGFMRYISEI